MTAKLTPQNFEIHSGDSKTLKFTIRDQNDAIKDITGATATWAAAKRKTSSTLISKTSGSGITITDATNGLLEVELDPADTEALKGDYYHELQLVDNQSRKSTAAYGTMTVRIDLITS